MSLVDSAYPPNQFIPVAAFARRAGVSKILVYKWIERGHLMHYRYGTGPRATIVLPISELHVARARKRRYGR